MKNEQQNNIKILMNRNWSTTENFSNAMLNAIISVGTSNPQTTNIALNEVANFHADTACEGMKRGAEVNEWSDLVNDPRDSKHAEVYLAVRGQLLADIEAV